MTAAEAEAWSPLTATQLQLPRRIIAFGAEETQPFHEQAAALDEKLRTQKSVSELAAIPRLNHMNVVLNLADPNGQLGGLLADLVSSS